MNPNTGRERCASALASSGERIAQDRAPAWKRVIWCPGAESNHRHCDFQSHALPTELPGRAPREGPEPIERAGYSGLGAACPPGFAKRLRRARPGCVQAGAGLPGSRAAQLSPRQDIGIIYLFPAVDLVISAGNDIGALQPAVQIDVAAARGAERTGGLHLRLAADRTGFEGPGGLVDLVVHELRSLHGVKEFKRLSARQFLGRRRIRLRRV